MSIETSSRASAPCARDLSIRRQPEEILPTLVPNKDTGRWRLEETTQA